MKKTYIYIAVFVVVVATAYILYRRGVFADISGVSEPSRGSTPLPPFTDTVAKSYAVGSTEIQDALTFQKKRILEDKERMNIIRSSLNADTKYLKGVNHSDSLRAIIVPDQHRTLAELDIFPSESPLGLMQRPVFEATVSAAGFEEFTRRGGIDSARGMWSKLADFRDVSNFTFWTQGADELIKQRGFGYSGDNDKNKSEMYNSWSESVKQFLRNVLKFQNDLNKAVENSALNDLTAAGWKIIGYNAAS